MIAEKSGHWVHLDEPEVVLAVIREMIAYAGETVGAATNAHG